MTAISSGNYPSFCGENVSGFYPELFSSPQIQSANIGFQKKRQSPYLSTGSLNDKGFNVCDTKQNAIQCGSIPNNIFLSPLSISASRLDCSVQYSNGTTPKGLIRAPVSEDVNDLLLSTRDTLVNRLCAPSLSKPQSCNVVDSHFPPRRKGVAPLSMFNDYPFVPSNVYSSESLQFNKSEKLLISTKKKYLSNNDLSCIHSNYVSQSTSEKSTAYRYYSHSDLPKYCSFKPESKELLPDLCLRKTNRGKKPTLNNVLIIPLLKKCLSEVEIREESLCKNSSLRSRSLSLGYINCRYTVNVPLSSVTSAKRNKDQVLNTGKKSDCVVDIDGYADPVDLYNPVLNDQLESRVLLRRTRSEMNKPRNPQSPLLKMGPEGNPRYGFGRQYSTPQPIKIRPSLMTPDYSGHTAENHFNLRRHKGSARLRRSVSQPLDLEKSFHDQVSFRSRLMEDHNPNRLKQRRRPSVGNLLTDDESSGDDDPVDYETDDGTELNGLSECKQGQEDEGIIFAEALWDHVSLDAEELVFKAGDLITVVDTSDRDWWWGRVTYRAGWFPASFVRLLVNQEDHDDQPGPICLGLDGGLSGDASWASRKSSVASLSHDQVRANVIGEIVSTERDYVKHLNDVVEGYLKQMRKRPDMFALSSISVLFGNMEALFAFHRQFLLQLESCVDFERPHLSCIGRCFIENKIKFEIYSEYCNNHPSAVLELQRLYHDQRYVHFFEACRLLQQMIDISLDGFLLTPVQKICKYPLQLQELLKYTSPKHSDYALVHGGLQAMKEVALLVNERRRRMESLEKIAKWQNSVEGWTGPSLLEDSSQLIHQGELTKGVGGSWPKDVTMFLFDHQLIYCKKDLLKRNTFVYRGRINTDLCEILDIQEDCARSAGVQHAWKIHCLHKNKTYVFTCKNSEEKEKWLQAFKSERSLVALDEASGFVATEKQKEVARMVARNLRSRPKKPRIKRNSRKAMTYAQARRLVSTEAPCPPVPHQRGPTPVMEAQITSEVTKKKGHWFIFGGHRKARSGHSRTHKIRHQRT